MDTTSILLVGFPLMAAPIMLVTLLATATLQTMLVLACVLLLTLSLIMLHMLGVTAGAEAWLGTGAHGTTLALATLSGGIAIGVALAVRRRLAMARLDWPPVMLSPVFVKLCEDHLAKHGFVFWPTGRPPLETRAKRDNFLTAISFRENGAGISSATLDRLREEGNAFFVVNRAPEDSVLLTAVARGVHIIRYDQMLDIPAIAAGEIASHLETAALERARAVQADAWGLLRPPEG